MYQQLHLDKNLSLGEGSALPVGVPVPWPSEMPPSGWLKCNGAAFSAADYPLLAKAYPSLKLPDLRGEFIRGWDDGRGVDSGRALLTMQGDDFREHNHELNMNGGYGQNYWTPAGGDSSSYDSVITTGSRGGNETRPRNIAFNYIVRAA
ncbi:tail fiber protein [Pantoea ananatis]|nr:tail fiber protein [Pantoea ananatis]